MMKILVSEKLGSEFKCQDALLLKKIIHENITAGLELDFAGTGVVPTTFFYTLLSDIIHEKGRNFVYEHLIVTNLDNYKDYKMVVLGMPSIAC